MFIKLFYDNSNPGPVTQGAPMPCPHRTAGDDGERQAGKEADRQERG